MVDDDALVTFRSALAVIVFDPKIKTFLVNHDPMALKQAQEAFALADHLYQQTHGNPD